MVNCHSSIRETVILQSVEGLFHLLSYLSFPAFLANSSFSQIGKGNTP